MRVIYAINDSLVALNEWWVEANNQIYMKWNESESECISVPFTLWNDMMGMLLECSSQC
jgi:hypothetical protein